MAIRQSSRPDDRVHGAHLSSFSLCSSDFSAYDTVHLTGKGGSQSKPEWGVQIGF